MQSGLSLSAKVFGGPSQVGADIALSEVAGVGYFGDYDLTTLADGIYNTVIYSGSNQIAGATLYVTDGAESIPGIEASKIHNALDNYPNKDGYIGSSGAKSMAIIKTLNAIDLSKGVWTDITAGLNSGATYRFLGQYDATIRFSISDTAPTLPKSGARLINNLAIHYSGTAIWLRASDDRKITPVEIS